MKTIASVQALRALAAISVVLCHFDQVFYILTGRGNEAFPLYFLASGVDLFFVISGFIMVLSSEPLFGTPNAAISFLERRLSRVVPLYWLATLTMLWLTSPAPSWAAISGSLFFVPYVPNMTTGQAVPILGVGWTLNYEMLFYALFAVSLNFPRRLAIGMVCVALLALGVIGKLNLIETQTAAKFWFDPIVIEFGMGILIAVLYRGSIKLPLAASVIMISVSVAVIYAFAGHVGGAGLPSGYRFLGWGVPAAMIFAAVVLGPSTRVPPAIRQFVVGLGDASYSMYLLHPIILTMISLLWGRYLSRFHIPPVLGIGLVVTILLSLIAYRLIELPAMTIMRSFSLLRLRKDAPHTTQARAG